MDLVWENGRDLKPLFVIASRSLFEAVDVIAGYFIDEVVDLVSGDNKECFMLGVLVDTLMSMVG